jgi:hypothetical protein
MGRRGQNFNCPNFSVDPTLRKSLVGMDQGSEFDGEFRARRIRLRGNSE